MSPGTEQRLRSVEANRPKVGLLRHGRAYDGAMGGVDRDCDAGTAVLAALSAISRRLDELESPALADDPDAVHQLRTHVRRLRSVLAAYEPLFDAAVVRALRRRYRELGRELGTVRDLEVRLQAARRSLEKAREAGDLDPAELEVSRARLIDEDVEAHRLAHARFVDRQRMPRATERRTALTEFLTETPLMPEADEPARPVLARLLEREARRAVRRASRASASSDLERLHAARKAGRRLRYVAEAVIDEPVALFGDAAQELADAGKALHDVLGDHRDQMLFAEYMRRAAAHAAHAGGPAHALEQLDPAADEPLADRPPGFDHAVRALRRAARSWSSR
ncbi:hypothetical protein DCE93_06040 [Agromyces badenianii]|uniref:CHAD domain-containing protein n=2 Tax=Agromyces badenianii TaxID=2080742 RepID=A0A2S0WVB4_9MICO|nr:hypothetical protein DCE93_06040 [Agromyces badenianii]